MKILLFSILAVAMIGLMIPSVDAASNVYTTTSFRLDEPPTFCTMDESLANPNFSGDWTQMVKDAVEVWENKLKANSDYPQFWEMGFVEDTYDCMIPIELKRQLLNNPNPPLGQFNWISSSRPIVTLVSSAFGSSIILDESKTEKAFAHVLTHEIGHVFGLGHHYNWNIIDPFHASIMYPLYDSSMHTYGPTNLDVTKIKELYGTYGFFAFSKNKPVGVIDPDTVIIEGIDAQERHQFEFVEISDTEIIEKTDRYNNEYVTIKGKVFDSAYLSGQPVRLFMTTPEKDLQILKARVSNYGDFSVMMEITDEWKKGVYRFEMEYATVTSGVHEVKFTIVEKKKETLDDTPIRTGSIVPAWIKNNAEWWALGDIDDNSFVQGIQFMIKENIISIPNLPESSSETAETVPAWIKNNAGWWADGQIDDTSFVQGIEYLVKVGIIQVN